MGSPAIAAWIAHLAFWGLLTFGVVAGMLSARGVISCCCCGSLAPQGCPMRRTHPRVRCFSSYVAILDIALVFIIFKGDVRLT